MRTTMTMTSTASQTTETLISVLRAAAADLNPNAVKALIAHPDAVRSALAATGAVLIQNGGAETTPGEIEIIGQRADQKFSAEEARKIVDERTAAFEPDEEALTSNEVAQRLGLKSRQSVHDWLRKGKLLGWQTAKRGYLFPARQFDQRNQPIEGLGEIVALFEYAEVAWDWLTAPLNSLGGEKPLTVLAKGELERVIEAAESHLQGDFG